MTGSAMMRPCPFCGSKDLKTGRRDSVAYVDCKGCRITVDFYESSDPNFDVEAAWNGLRRIRAGKTGKVHTDKNDANEAITKVFEKYGNSLSAFFEDIEKQAVGAKSMIRRTNNKETTSVQGWSGVVEDAAGLQFSLAVKDGESIVSFGNEYEGGSDAEIVAAVRKEIESREAELATLHEFVRVAESVVKGQNPLTEHYGIMAEEDSRSGRQLAGAVASLVDALRAAGANVLGLPCFCDTPHLHSEACVAVRQAISRVQFELGQTPGPLCESAPGATIRGIERKKCTE